MQGLSLSLIKLDLLNGDGLCLQMFSFVYQITRAHMYRRFLLSNYTDSIHDTITNSRQLVKHIAQRIHQNEFLIYQPRPWFKISESICQQSLVLISSISAINIDNISHISNIGPDIGRYHMVNIVQGTSRPNMVFVSILSTS